MLGVKYFYLKNFRSSGKTFRISFRIIHQFYLLSPINLDNQRISRFPIPFKSNSRLQTPKANTFKKYELFRKSMMNARKLALSRTRKSWPISDSPRTASFSRVFFHQRVYYLKHFIPAVRRHLIYYFSISHPFFSRETAHFKLWRNSSYRSKRNSVSNTIRI